MRSTQTPEQRAAEIVDQRATGIDVDKLYAAATAPMEATPMDPELENRIAEFASHRREAKRWLERWIMSHADEISGSIKGFGRAFQVRNGALRTCLPNDVLDVIDSIPMKDEELANEVGRILAVVGLKKVAGTLADRIQARERMQAAEAAHTERTPIIEAEIIRLNAETNELTRARDQAAAEVATYTNAVVELRKHAPQQVKDDHERALATLVPIRNELGEVGTNLNNARAIAAIDIERNGGINVVSDVKSILSTRRPDLLKAGTRGDEISVPGWLKFREQTAKTIPALEARIVELKAKLAALEAQAAEDYLDVYSAE